ncbi:hypothetical protein [Pseudoduganella sp. OTU4001]|uniref:hypothetical protein n=1 Tax=Pseudoduganella sp. OTU4001 TaxID=3043854 RepID=UPI00313C7E6D
MADLMSPMARIVAEHRETIVSKLGGEAALAAALRNERAIESVADVCYTLLPGVVRLAVKEPQFRAFVLANRDQVVALLLPA